MPNQTKKWKLQQLTNIDPEIKIDEKYHDIVVGGLTLDSRKVEKDFLFAALKGSNSNGSQFIGSAVESGASVILCDTDVEVEVPAGVCLIKHNKPRKLFSLFASKYYDKSPEVVAAVTGTNGKTSVVHFCREIWKAMGEHAASVGTVGIEDSQGKVDFDRANFLTTPDPVKLRKIIAQLAERGVSHMAMEASSHGLDQYRIDGLHVKIGAFTNFSRDHLDYHGTFENYLNAKMRLFSEVMDEKGVAVLNADIEQYQQLETACYNRGHTVFSYGKYNQKKRNYIDIYDIIHTSEGQQISFEIMGRLYNVNTPLIGEFQAYNLLCALAIVVASGANIDEAVAVLDKVPCVPGRMERVGNSNIFVDYSHTPDALEKALSVLQPVTKGKLWVVFGCGGDRDKGKRPIMGEVANRLADQVIITDDNPRGEDPAQIRSEILAAADNAEEIGDRHEAIKKAVSNMAQTDILLIAGKGHEKTQTIGDQQLPFDDVVVAREVM